jgi:DNA-binding IclR family transcriptional regulator
MKAWVPYSERANQIIAFLRAGPATQSEIESQIGMRPWSATKVLARMLDEGQIKLAPAADRDHVRGPKPKRFEAVNG